MSFPGVPALLDPSAILGEIPQLLTGDAVGLLGDLFTLQWGIFMNGSPVISAQSTLTVEFMQDYTIANFPVEQGAFQTYDKVTMPFNIKLMFSCGGLEADRAAFLQSVMDIADDTNLYDVVTPEQTYNDCNVSHYDYRRTSENGLGLLQIGIYMQQIRQGSDPGFQNTIDPTSKGTVNVGQVQAESPSDVQAAVAATGSFF